MRERERENRTAWFKTAVNWGRESLVSEPGCENMGMTVIASGVLGCKHTLLVLLEESSEGTDGNSD